MYGCHGSGVCCVDGLMQVGFYCLCVGCAGASSGGVAFSVVTGGSCAWAFIPVLSRWCEMTEGPIAFASDGPRDTKGPTEYGGRAGLIQGGAAAGEVHELTGPEKRGLIVRAKAVQVVDPVTGFLKPDEAAAVDPHTGMLIDPEWNEDGSTAAPVEAPPRTGNATDAEV